VNISEWERKTNTKPIRELRGIRLEQVEKRAPMGCGNGKRLWDSKVQTRRVVRTKQASEFWKWHLQYEKENTK
jgi:hypothetical protein